MNEGGGVGTCHHQETASGSLANKGPHLAKQRVCIYNRIQTHSDVLCQAPLPSDDRAVTVWHRPPAISCPVCTLAGSASLYDNCLSLYFCVCVCVSLAHRSLTSSAVYYTLAGTCISVRCGESAEILDDLLRSVACTLVSTSCCIAAAAACRWSSFQSW